MSGDSARDVPEALAIEEADAWFEYLDATRSHQSGVRYEEVEPWAWAHLKQRLRDAGEKRTEIRSAAA